MQPAARLKPCPFKAPSQSLKAKQKIITRLRQNGRSNKKCHAEMTFKNPRDRLRPDRHRPVRRVRLLRHPGLQGPQGRGLRSRPGELQPGDHHDRPRARRPHLHRAPHAGVSRRNHPPRIGDAPRDQSRGAANSPSCPPSAARPHSTSPSNSPTPASSTATTSNSSAPNSKPSRRPKTASSSKTR